MLAGSWREMDRFWIYLKVESYQECADSLAVEGRKESNQDDSFGLNNRVRDGAVSCNREAWKGRAGVQGQM